METVSSDALLVFTFTYINSYEKHHGRRLRIPSFDDEFYLREQILSAP